MWLIFAVLCALLFGLRAVLYQWTSQQNMNRNLMLSGVFTTGFLFGIAGMIILGHRWVSVSSVIAGVSLGVGSYCGNAALYKGFAVGKAAIVSVLAGLPPLFVVMIAFVTWGETLSMAQLSGFLVIFIGINMIRFSNELSFKNLQGAQWGILAALCFSITDILAKQTTRLGAETFATLVLMFGAGGLMFTLSWWFNRERSNGSDDSTKWSEGRTYLAGMAVGVTNVLGVICMITAFHDGPTGLVSAIAAMNVLVVLLYSRMFLKDTFRRIEMLGISAAILGILVLRLTQ